MAEQLTVREVHATLEEYLRNRSDVGVWRGMATRVMGPKNPFEPESVRKPRLWFVLFLAVSVAATGAFVYFNFGN